MGLGTCKDHEAMTAGWCPWCAAEQQRDELMEADNEVDRMHNLPPGEGIMRQAREWKERAEAAEVHVINGIVFFERIALIVDHSLLGNSKQQVIAFIIDALDDARAARKAD